MKLHYYVFTGRQAIPGQHIVQGEFRHSALGAGENGSARQVGDRLYFPGCINYVQHTQSHHSNSLNLPFRAIIEHCG
jgi:hypothetical protein